MVRSTLCVCLSIFGVGLLTGAVSVDTVVLNLKKESGHVAFTAHGHPGALKIEGKGDGPEGTLSIGPTLTGGFQFNLQSIDTGIGLRTQHTKNKYLEVSKFSTATLSIEPITTPDISK